MDDEEHCKATAENLPQDLIYQILSFLPVKTLIRFRSVCKSWYSLIADSSFIKLHLANHSSCGEGDSRYILAIAESSYCRPISFNSVYCSLTSGKTCDMQRSTMDLPLLDVTGYSIIEGSCNGLICLYCSHDKFGNHMYIWNPCIRRLKPIPPHVSPPWAKRHDSCLSGIGFHEPTNDYIVVKLTYYDNSTKHQVDVYSLNADSWRTVTRSNKFLPDSDRRSASLNGYIYWLGKGNMITSFSTSGDDLFEQMMLPTHHKEYNKNLLPVDIEVVKESLYLLTAPHISFGEGIDICDIWVMKEHGIFESWTKLYSVEMKEGIMKHCGVSRHVCFIYGLTVNGELLLTMEENAEWPNEDLFVYDHKNVKLVNLQTQGGFSIATSFMGSLVLLDCPGTKSELWIPDDRYRWDR